MSKSTTPRTDANKHSIDHLERYGFENSLDDPVVEWPILCEEIERELAEAREQRDRLADELADWHNAAKHVAACHPDEAHCGCVTILWKQITDALTQRDSLAEAMHVIVDVSRKNLDKPHPTIERVYAKAFDSVKGGTP
jgi:hypothetical protein